MTTVAATDADLAFLEQLRVWADDPRKRLYDLKHLWDQKGRVPLVLKHYDSRSHKNAAHTVIANIINQGGIVQNTSGKLSIDLDNEAEYWQEFLQRLSRDVVDGHQLPISAIYKKGRKRTFMFDCDLKLTDKPITEDSAKYWGLEVLKVMKQAYPFCRWEKNIPFLVVSIPPANSTVRTMHSCSKCGAPDPIMNYESTEGKCNNTACNFKGPVATKRYYNGGIHVDLCQVRNRSGSEVFRHAAFQPLFECEMKPLAEDSDTIFLVQKNDDICPGQFVQGNRIKPGTIVLQYNSKARTVELNKKVGAGANGPVQFGEMVYAGCTPAGTTDMQLKLREVLIDNILHKTSEEREKMGLLGHTVHANLSDIVDKAIYGSGRLRNYVSGLVEDADARLRPCWTNKSGKCDCKVNFVRRGGTSKNNHDPDCSKCGGKGFYLDNTKVYMPVWVLDFEGNPLKHMETLYAGGHTLQAILDLQRLTSHHLTANEPTTPGFCLGNMWAGPTAPESDIQTRVEDEHQNLVLCGLETPKVRYCRKSSLVQKWTKPSTNTHWEPFEVNTPEGRKVRSIIEGALRKNYMYFSQAPNQISPTTFDDRYFGINVGNYCKALASPEMRLKIYANLQGQGSGWCPNALHCHHGLPRRELSPGGDYCRKCKRETITLIRDGKRETKVGHTWGCHRGQNCPLRVEVRWNGRAAVLSLHCYSEKVGYDGKKCRSLVDPTKKRAANNPWRAAPGAKTITLGFDESAILFPQRAALLNKQKKTHQLKALTGQKRPASSGSSAIIQQRNRKQHNADVVGCMLDLLK